MGVLKAEKYMTAERAERVEVAEAMEERNKNPLDKAIRRGGYFLSSSGIPIDAHGERIPESEWTDEDKKRLKPEQAAATETTKRDGADVVEGSLSENRKGAQGPRRGV